MRSVDWRRRWKGAEKKQCPKIGANVVRRRDLAPHCCGNHRRAIFSRPRALSRHAAQIMSTNNARTVEVGKCKSETIWCSAVAEKLDGFGGFLGRIGCVLMELNRGILSLVQYVSLIHEIAR